MSSIKQAIVVPGKSFDHSLLAEELALYNPDGTAYAPEGGGSNVTQSATAPENPSAGDLWYDTDNGALFIYYDSAWVEVVGTTGPQGPAGPMGPPGAQGAQGPAGGTLSWTTVVSADGSSLTPFYTTDGAGVGFGDTGTWTVSSGAIRQEHSDGNWHMAVLYAGAGFANAWAASVEMKADGGWGSKSALMLTSKAIHDSGINRWQPFVMVNNGEDQTNFVMQLLGDYNGSNATERNITLGARDTNYHKLSIVGLGTGISVYWDEVHVGNYIASMVNSGYGAMWDSIAVGSNQGDVNDHGPRHHYFKNFAAYALDLGLPFVTLPQ